MFAFTSCAATSWGLVDEELQDVGELENRHAPLLRVSHHLIAPFDSNARHDENLIEVVSPEEHHRGRPRSIRVVQA